MVPTALGTQHSWVPTHTPRYTAALGANTHGVSSGCLGGKVLVARCMPRSAQYTARAAHPPPPPRAPGAGGLGQGRGQKGTENGGEGCTPGVSELL